MKFEHIDTKVHILREMAVNTTQSNRMTNHPTQCVSAPVCLCNTTYIWVLKDTHYPIAGAYFTLWGGQKD